MKTAGSRFSKMTIRTFLLLFLTLFVITACGGKHTTSVTAPVVSRDTRIILPDLPQRIAIETPGKTTDLKTKYLHFPSEVKPNAVWKAPVDGGWVWNGKDLQALVYGLVEPWKWIDKTSAIVENHNRAVAASKADAHKSWWSKLW